MHMASILHVVNGQDRFFQRSSLFFTAVTNKHSCQYLYLPWLANVIHRLGCLKALFTRPISEADFAYG